MKLEPGPWKPKTKAKAAQKIDDSILIKTRQSATKAPESKKNDGTVGIDGFRIKPQVWTECASCERPIFYIKIGDHCVFCK